MLNQPTIDKLLAMRMVPVVEAWRAFEQDENTQALSFEEKLSLMVDRLWTWRQNLALERRLRYAKLRGNACVEDINYRAARGLDFDHFPLLLLGLLQQIVVMDDLQPHQAKYNRSHPPEQGP